MFGYLLFVLLCSVFLCGLKRQEVRDWCQTQRLHLTGMMLPCPCCITHAQTHTHTHRFCSGFDRPRKNLDVFLSVCVSVQMSLSPLFLLHLSLELPLPLLSQFLVPNKSLSPWLRFSLSAENIFQLCVHHKGCPLICKHMLGLCSELCCSSFL